mmetsp:Transcript_24792/g.41949  ORF Transcript_24792/g.41949 Transcript_24792/m.41949 type:complete len:315 (+) Transcript_24792:22-966(+)
MDTQPEQGNDAPPTPKPKLCDVIRNAYLEMEAEMVAFDEKKAEWDALVAKVTEHATAAPRKIKLDIGGEKFTTTKETLLRFQDSFFYAMIGSGHWSPDEDGVYFVDRDPAYFRHVMEFMRSGNTSFFSLAGGEYTKVKEEFEFYQLPFPEEPVAWDTSLGGSAVSYTDANQRLATKSKAGCSWDSNCISKYPVKRYRVEITNHGNDSNGYIMMGFIERSAFNEYGQNYSSQNAYCIYVYNGALYGNGKSDAGYFGSRINVGQILECVHNSEDKTISFSVNGECKGVAFADVQFDDLHALCCFHSPNNQVKLLLD